MTEEIIIIIAEAEVMIEDTMTEIENTENIDTEIIEIEAETMKEEKEAAETMKEEREVAETETETMIETIDILDMTEIKYRILIFDVVNFFNIML